MKPEKDEGRKAEPKELHKGDWGSHTKADHAAEEQQPTQEQLQHAQETIAKLWIIKGDIGE